MAPTLWTIFHSLGGKIVSNSFGVKNLPYVNPLARRYSSAFFRRNVSVQAFIFAMFCMHKHQIDRTVDEGKDTGVDAVGSVIFCVAS